MNGLSEEEWRQFEEFAERVADKMWSCGHPEFCAHKIMHYQSTGKGLSCKECPRTKCHFHGCSI